MLDCKPVTVIGEDDPVSVYPPGDEVTVNDVAAGDSAGKENVTVAAPLLNALPVPTFVADTLVGANGSKKSFDAAERLPVFLAICFYPLITLLDRRKQPKCLLLS